LRDCSGRFNPVEIPVRPQRRDMLGNHPVNEWGHLVDDSEGRALICALLLQLLRER
jgi:hypothetical protein